MERTLDIYYRDFLRETQSAILEAAGIQDPRETNWDTLPITVLSFEVEKGGNV